MLDKSSETATLNPTYAYHYNKYRDDITLFYDSIL